MCNEWTNSGIMQDDKVIDLESSMTYPVVYSVFKYVYLGKFERYADVFMYTRV